MRYLMITVLAALVAMNTHQSIVPVIEVMTYNVRYGTADDGLDSWPHRREALLRQVKAEDPDILAVQEAFDFQIDELSAALPDHGLIGVGRDDGVRAGEHTAIFYRRETMGLLEGGTRWISATPFVPGSIGPGAWLPRVFAWGQFHHVAGAQFLLIDVHLDHQSEDARVLGCKMMEEFAKERKLPTIITGDFNCTLESRPIALLRDAGFASAAPSSGPLTTFNKFEANPADADAIDHFFVRGEWRINEVRIDRSTTNGRAHSDHFPVIGRFELPPRELEFRGLR
ncbi:MAG: endonuclease/exonuclease/phosphatase family protein [Fimbriimonadaceae bacterium]|nr:endonuclease/exonuclease/phosphatase family protein [Fimbriimonadaceae bacterium]